MENNPTLLIVDDDYALRETFELFFQFSGFSVIKVSSGNEAVKKLNQEKIDVVLTDCDMEDGNGFLVVKHCDSMKVPCLMQSGYNIESRTQIERQLVIGRYIMKPLSASHALKLIKGLLQPVTAK